MRQKIVAGNWKMNGSAETTGTLLTGIAQGLPQLPQDCTVIVAPPFPYLAQAAALLQGGIQLAAQNCHFENAGAYTGEVSPAMLKDVGCSWVILGHSERRQYFGEDDALLAKKTDAARAAGLKVIFCCGEPLEERDADTQNAFVEAQLRGGLFHLDAAALKDVVIAYEPIWAIGTGRTASAQQAQDMHAHIRSVLTAQYGPEAAGDMTILYGGSAKPSNAAELFAGADVDGGLIGGAALKADEFLGIINALIGS